MPRRVLVLGSSGMAGHLLALHLRGNPDFDVVDVGPRARPFPGSLTCDLSDRASLEALLSSEKPDYLVNCVGVLVRASEENKLAAISINARLPHLLAELCEGVGCRFIHLSTDCVFSGGAGPYDREAAYDGQDFYGRSKALGEFDDVRGLVIRTSIIGPELRSGATGLFSWFMSNPDGSRVTGYRKALWSGVTTLELAKFIEAAIRAEPAPTGLVQYSVEGGISKYELLRLIAEVFRKDIEIGARDEPAIDKRLVPTRLAFSDGPRAYRIQLAELAEWMKGRRESYGNQMGGM